MIGAIPIRTKKERYTDNLDKLKSYVFTTCKFNGYYHYLHCAKIE